MTDGQARVAESVKAAAIDAAIDGIVIARPDGEIVDCNPAAETLFGAGKAKLRGTTLAALIGLPPGTAWPAHELADRTERNGTRRDGATFPADIAFRQIQVDGQTFVVAYVRDLTADQKADVASEAQRQRLAQVEKLSAMGSLLAGVAHELNNPLAILVAQSTVLRDRAPTPDIERRAERIHAAALRAGRIVKSFLAMAQHKSPVLERVDINAAIDDALQFVAYGLRNAGVTVLRNFDPGRPEVEADRDLLGQVFASLLVNAQQAVLERTEGRIIQVSTVSQQGFVTIDIEDNGNGVPPNLAERIFDPYFTTRAAGSAIGVGLSLCRSILSSHAGSIALCDTSASEGARFRVSLPQAEAASRDHHPGETGKAGGLSVLVVDDERDVAESLAELIELFGHEVSVETSAAAALARIADQAFDMVFSDYHMPGVDGLAFRRAIARLNATLASHTVLMTGDTVSRSGRDDLSTEANGLILEKPFTASNVGALLDRINQR